MKRTLRFALSGAAVLLVLVGAYLLVFAKLENISPTQSIQLSAPGMNQPTSSQGAGHSRDANASVYAFEDDADLFALVNKLAPLSDSGDARASRLIANAYQECWAYANDPSGFGRDIEARIEISPQFAQGLAHALDQTQRRCKGFIGTAIGPGSSGTWLRKAAQQGDLASRILVSMQDAAVSGTSLSPGQHRELANSVIGSSDAEAYAAMSALMGPAANGMQDALAPLPAGSVQSEAAWNIAACRLGRPCSSSSATVLQMCLQGGVNCSLRPLEQFYLQEMLPPADHAKLRQQIDILLKEKGKS
jgi:hypothetical protein